MSDEDVIKKAIRDQFVFPVGQFRAQAGKLDSIHSACLEDFCKAVWSLIDGDGGTFSGHAADTFATLMGQYIDVDRFFANYDRGLSKKLGIAADDCDRASKEVEYYVDTFPYADGTTRPCQVAAPAQPDVQSPGNTSAPDAPGGEGGGEIVVALLAIVYFYKTTAQQDQLEHINSVIDQWSNNMWNLATSMEHETALPPLPKAATFVPDLGSILDPPVNVVLTREQKLHADAAKADLDKLKATYDDSEVNQLASLGLTPDEIVQAILARATLSAHHTRFKLSRLAQLAQMGYNANQIETIVTRVDELSVRFRKDAERGIAYWLVLTGKADKVTPVVAQPSHRNPDATVELHVGKDVLTVTMEFKSLQPSSTESTLENRLLESLKGEGQAPYMTFDVRQTKITPSDVANFFSWVSQRIGAGAIKPELLKYILIIGNGFSREQTFP